jgi:hypothetical protein
LKEHGTSPGICDIEPFGSVVIVIDYHQTVVFIIKKGESIISAARILTVVDPFIINNDNYDYV